MLAKILLHALVLAASSIAVAVGPTHVIHRRAFEVVSAREELPAEGAPVEEEAPVDNPFPSSSPKPVLSRDGVCWNSILDLEWSVSQLEYQSSVVSVPDEESSAWGYVSFNLSNTATTYTADCTAASKTNADLGFFDGEQEYFCALREGAPEGSQVAFRFNKATGLLAIQETILCSEGGISGTFIVRGTTEVSLACSEETNENENFTNREVKCDPVDASLWPYQVVGLDEY